MPIWSVVIQDVVIVALVVGILSAVNKRFVWKDISVYAVVAASCAEILFDLVTHGNPFGLLVWFAVAIIVYLIGFGNAKFKQRQDAE